MDEGTKLPVACITEIEKGELDGVCLICLPVYPPCWNTRSPISVGILLPSENRPVVLTVFKCFNCVLCFLIDCFIVYFKDDLMLLCILIMY